MSAKRILVMGVLTRALLFGSALGAPGFWQLQLRCRGRFSSATYPLGYLFAIREFRGARVRCRARHAARTSGLHRVMAVEVDAAGQPLGHDTRPGSNECPLAMLSCSVIWSPESGLGYSPLPSGNYI